MDSKPWFPLRSTPLGFVLLAVRFLAAACRGRGLGFAICAAKVPDDRSAREGVIGWVGWGWEVCAVMM